MLKKDPVKMLMKASRITGIVLVILLQLKVVKSNTLSIDLQKYKEDYTICSNALMAEKQKILIYGSVNFYSDDRFWNQLITIQYKKRSTNDQYEIMCSIDSNATVSTIPSSGCYCYNSSNNYKQFKIDITATLEYSDAEIRAAMYDQNGEIIYSKTHKLPPVIKNIIHETEEGIVDLSKCDTTCNMTNSTTRMCCYFDETPCKSIRDKNEEKANDSVDNCTASDAKPYKDNSAFDGSFPSVKVTKICVVENTAQEQDNTVLTALLIVIAIFILVMIVSICLWKKYSSKCKQEQQKEDPETDEKKAMRDLNNIAL